MSQPESKDTEHKSKSQDKALILFHACYPPGPLPSWTKQRDVELGEASYSSLDRLVKAHTPKNRHTRWTSQATCRGFDTWLSAVGEAGPRAGPKER